MTLVVARKSDDKVFIVADCLVSGGNQDLRAPDYALKILVVSPTTAVAYSGSPHLAHRIIKEALDRSACGSEDLVEALRIQIGEAELEFLVVDQNEIAEIKNGTVERNVAAGWLGDVKAFNLFQHSVNERTERQFATRMVESMAAVCGSPNIETVGGPVVAAESGIDGVRYSQWMQFTSPRYIPRFDFWETVDFGNAENGGFGFTTITPPRAGLSGWGLYYFQGNIGFYFHADLSIMKFEILKGRTTTAEQFCSLLEPEIGYLPSFVGQLG